MGKINNILTIEAVIVLFIVFILSFSFLGKLPIQKWDEARIANNAIEMSQNNNFIVTHYDGSPDMWNTKPPFLIWCQVFFFKVIGISELSLRLPTGLALFFTSFSLIFFFSYFKKLKWVGYLSVLILISFTGYNDIHTGRTGDYDIMLCFFTTISCLFLFLFLEKKQPKYLFYFFLSLTLAVLTKSTSGLLFIPGIFIYLIYKKKLFFLLRNKQLYYNLFLFFIIVSGYFFLRDFFNPGYLEAANNNDFLGRFTKPQEGNEGGFLYYIRNIKSKQIGSIIFLIPVGAIFGAINKKTRDITIYCLILISSFLLIISIAKTKLWWYDLPTFPFLAILGAIVVYSILDISIHFINKNLKIIFFEKVMKLLIIILFISFPIYKNYKKNLEGTSRYSNLSVMEEYTLSYYLKNAIDHNIDLNDHNIIFHGYDAHLRFYQKLYEFKGINVEFIDEHEICINDIIIVNQNDIQEHIIEHYTLERLNKFKDVITYRVTGFSSCKKGEIL